MVKTLEQENVIKMLEDNEEENSSMKNGVLNNSMEEETDVEAMEIAKPVEQMKIQTYDKDLFSFTVFVMVKKMTEVNIEFLETGFTMEFKTEDEAFLKVQNTESNDQLFVWRVKTKTLLDLPLCHYKLNSIKMEIFLSKKEPVKWDCLEFNSDDDLPVEPDRTKQKIVKQNIIQNGNSIKENSENGNTHIKDFYNSSVEPGLVGLRNLGNSCFMNSVLQCLSNIKELREFFLSGKYKEDLNEENVLGFKGKLAVAFAELLQMLWSGGSSTYVSPFKLKHLIGQWATQFIGYQQHDAQELMTFLLDALHEDLNRVRIKPYGETIEEEGKPDEQIAQETWLMHKKRNDSIIVDLFQGQYKSVLICPDCGKVSTTFDPFFYLTIPLPKDKVHISVIFFPKLLPQKPLRLKVWVDLVVKVEDLKKMIASKTRTRYSNLRIIEVQNQIIKQEYADSDDISANQNIRLYVFEVCDNPDLEISVMQRITYTQTIDKCCFCQTESKHLKRCTSCFNVAYCDRECQTNHWPNHKLTCKFNCMPVGEPFKVALEKSQIGQLYEILEAFAKISVIVVEYPSQLESNPNLGKGDASSISSENEEESSYNNSYCKHKMFDIYYKTKSSLNEFTKLEKLEELDLEEKEIGIILDWKHTSYPISRMVKSQKLEFEEIEDHTEDPNTRVTLDQCLKLFTEPEKLSSKEAWYCPQCKAHKEATKKLNLWKIPKILVIQLKRFSYHSIRNSNKIEKSVQFPIKNLDLNSYACKPSQQVYDLMCVSNHSGTHEQGHYTALAQAYPERWYSFDDMSVYPVETVDEYSRLAYLLFYRCRDIQS